jgi:procyclic form-specific polypeptide B-alpha (fragment)
MKVHYFIINFLRAIIGLSFLFLVSCQEEFRTNEEGDDCFVEFSFIQSPVETRAVVGEDGSGSFTDGDKIDLYTRSVSGAKHFLLTMQDGQWKPQIRRSQLGEGDVTLTGYYPATEPAQSPDEEYCHAVSDDQSTEESFTASDLLRGYTQLADGKTLVQMDFSHAMHRLRVNVQPQAGGSLPADLKVEVLSKRSGTVAGDGVATVDARADAEWITAHAMTEGWAAILFPQSTESYKLQDWIRLTTGEKSSTFRLPENINGKPFTRFETGQEVTVDLTLTIQGGEAGTYTLTFDSNGGTGEIPPRHLKPGEKTIMPDGAEYFTKPNGKFYAWNSSPEMEGIEEWVVGGTFTMPDHDMTVYAIWHLVDDNIGGACEEFKGQTKWLKGIEPPKESDWEQVLTWDHTDGLDGKTVPTRPGCGWYDVSQDIYDMCWAAGASDVLHYWMDRNQEYLDRYGYDGPRQYNYQSAGSEIFNEFLKYWDNWNGGYVQSGFYWYLVGSETKGGGYFKDVFDGKVKAENVIAVGDRKAVSRKAFTETLTKAFKEDMAIGLAMPSIGKIHQHIVWGAEYDDEGYIKAVYYVNPNDFRQHVGTENGHKIGLLYMEIVYLEDGGAYTEASVPGNYIPIQRIDVCGIGQDVWEEYFRTHPEK